MHTPFYQKVYSVFGYSVLIGTAIMIPIIALQLPASFTWSEVVRNYWPSVLMSITYTFVLSEGNGYLNSYLDRFVRWIDQPVKRLVLSIVVMFVYSTAAILLVEFIAAKLIWEAHCAYTASWSDYYLKNLYLPLGITVIITTFLSSRKFLLEWRKSAVETERLRAENLASRYQSLKEQINPHFLFNSLNTLTYLVYENQDQAAQFIKKLSEVYRYVLDTRDQEVVTWQEELAFVRSYVFLQKIRFGNSLRICIDLPENLPGMIPPLSLQMLLENAVKHNEVSEEQPLLVNITLEEEAYVVVSNNVQPKDIGERPSGIGLNNIKARYAYLTPQPVVVSSNACFTVKLPLLRTEEAAWPKPARVES